jgi:hypothetical protein
MNKNLELISLDDDELLGVVGGGGCGGGGCGGGGGCYQQPCEQSCGFDVDICVKICC